MLTAAAAAAAILRAGCVVQLSACVDQGLRRRIRCHHTATHLLQSALKSVLGPDTCQQGSLVEANRLRSVLVAAKTLCAL